MPRLLVLLSALAVALGGCVSISAESARQLDEVGDVELTTVLCASQVNSGVSCPASNTSEITDGDSYQLLMGYRLPSNSAPPESIAATDVALTLSRSTSYTAELEALAPAPAGQRWVGYISPPFVYDALQTDQSATIVARILLSRGADGKPFPAPFRYRTVVGYRQAGEEPNRAVRCGERLSSSNSTEQTTCMTSPTEDDLATDLSLQTRDLGIIAGASGSVPRGGSGTVPFNVAYDGEGASPSFALSASTTVPGGTAGLASASVAPASAGSTIVPVTVTVPDSTAPGTYEVTLTASHPGGQVRRAGGLVDVTGSDPVDRTPPELAARLKGTPRVRRAIDIGLVADVSCSEECRVDAQLRAGKRSARALRLPVPPGQRDAIVGSVAEKRHAAGRRNVRIRFSKGLGPRLVRLRRVSLSMRITARDRAGNIRRRSLKFTLKR